MRVVPCKTSYCKTNFKWEEGILPASKKLKLFSNFLYGFLSFAITENCFHACFDLKISLFISKMSWWDHQSIIWRNRLIAKLKDGFCQGRSDHLSKKNPTHSWSSCRFGSFSIARLKRPHTGSQRIETWKMAKNTYRWSNLEISQNLWSLWVIFTLDWD